MDAILIVAFIAFLGTGLLLNLAGAACQRLIAVAAPEYEQQLFRSAADAFTFRLLGVRVLTLLLKPIPASVRTHAEPLRVIAAAHVACGTLTIALLVLIWRG